MERVKKKKMENQNHSQIDKQYEVTGITSQGMVKERLFWIIRTVLVIPQLYSIDKRCSKIQSICDDIQKDISGINNSKQLCHL